MPHDTNTSMSGSELRCGNGTKWGCKLYVSQPCIIVLKLGPYGADVMFHQFCVPDELNVQPAFMKNWRKERAL